MKKVLVVGAGPAGLMAAQVLSAAGVAVQVFDAMPSVGRKFLLAGKGGLNLTHSEAEPAFLSRYGLHQEHLWPGLQNFGAQQVREWAGSLGVSTFVGTSGRVFPQDMKAAPLLRAWLHRLRHPLGQGEPVQFHMRHRWLGWDATKPEAFTCLSFARPEGEQVHVHADAVVLALGGGSWARLGSTGAWVPWLQAQGVQVLPLQPANMGFDVAGGWSPYFAQRFAGQPLKSVALRFVSAKGEHFERKGEFVATATGIEGSLVYAAAAGLRDTLQVQGSVTLELDLLPDWSFERVLREVAHPRGSRSLGSHLKSRLHLEGIKAALLHEKLSKEQLHDAATLASAIKALSLTLAATRPLDEAISSAGGVCWSSLDEYQMLRPVEGVFCAGEMLDWEAPTGGYLLTACLSTGVAAGQGVLTWLKRQ